MTEPTRARLATTDAEILSCFQVMEELRSQLRREEFVSVIRQQQSEGYRLAMLEDANGVTTVGGFRVQRMLHTGKTMYVDDLVTAASERSRGHGRAMLQWLMDLARREGCKTFSLDSGTQRQEAHAFYLRERLRITSFHFACKL